MLPQDIESAWQNIRDCNIMESFDRSEIVHLRQLSAIYPNQQSVLAQIVALQAELALPKPTVHVLSDIHGEFEKLKHVINNASGSLRPLVQRIFSGEASSSEYLAPDEQNQLLNFIHYPRESFVVWSMQHPSMPQRKEFLTQLVRREVAVIRELAARHRVADIERIVPQHYSQFLRELVLSSWGERSQAYITSAVSEFIERGSELDLLRALARLIRNLLVSELVIAGDFGDRGPRIDRVIDFVMRQPHVSIVWGNHDMSWLGACLGHEACVATVIRISLRYRRLSQLEEGYGIPMAPLEKLVRTVYADDPAECFPCKGQGLRDAAMMARMQKAIAIIQFKLEGQLSQRNPQFDIGRRNLLSHIDPKTGTISIGGVTYPMKDSNFPTIDWEDPFRLSAEEIACLSRLCQSFLVSPTLWTHMQYMVRRGSMYLERDGHLIFHGCVPVDMKGEFLTLEVDGQQCSGRALFLALQRVVRRALRERRQPDLDMLWYLWGGERSPLFGKDKMATFETYFLDEKQTHHEHKNRYFELLHEKSFCEKVLSEFGVSSPHALIVNGHVPVKVDAGEEPMKRSGMAVTIDGAFSQAYGDKGFTLVLEAGRTYLAQHHHFDSVSDSIQNGTDIIPTIREIRRFESPRLVRDTEAGAEVMEQREQLRRLARAYEDGMVAEAG